MAKKSMVARNDKRMQLSVRYAEKRAAIKKRIINPDLNHEERFKEMMALQKLPRDGSKSRYRNRCAVTGRPRGYYRRFGLARNALREAFINGLAPGVMKSSW